ncbi:MAG: single-stranded-DNA-specific exonuclease RecJ [Magnetococcales bacterium]|nr:single-stranded-DNA-specific exonuclease RecJ [Magnetococcales bacterium]
MMNLADAAGSALSFTGKGWRLRAQTSNLHHRLAQQAGLHGMFATILADRGLTDLQEVERFLRPLLSHLVDPLGLSDMDKAVVRLVQMVENHQPCAIFGDYDVDGVTSCALLYRYFQALGQPPRIYIPDRLTEGYGPNVAALRSLRSAGIQVVITVDCGITAYDALQVAAEIGLDVIVTDHHQARPDLPMAVAVVNPNRLDDPFPHKELAGVGVAFYLVMALNRALRERGWFGPRTEPDLKSLLDLVAIGTIADVASLTGLNRSLATVGLRTLATTTKVGLHALMEMARLRGSMNAGQIGFQIGPRINAGGRLGQGILGAELLMTDDPAYAMEIATTLEEYNQERQQVERKILAESVDQVESQRLDQKRRGMVVAGEGWHPGVVGIVASRLVERYHRPAIVMAMDHAGGGKGSARSIPGVDLLAAVTACADTLLGYGGHRAAAGMTLVPGKLDALMEAFDQAVRLNNPPELFQPVLRVDGEIALDWIDLELGGRLERLQPFGRGNPEPVWVARNVRILDPRILQERHIRCLLLDQTDSTLDAIAFGVLPGSLGQGLMQGTARLDVAGTVSINRYNNRERMQFIIKDARPALGEPLWPHLAL